MNNIQASNEFVHKSEYSQIQNVEDEFQTENLQKSNNTVSKLMSFVTSNLNQSLILKLQDIVGQDKVRITNSCVLVGLMLINIKSKDSEIESQVLYSRDKLEEFKKEARAWRKDQNQKLPPHVWTLIEMAIYQLFDQNNQKKKSSIIITGPSGSGKTFTTRKIIEYLVSFDQQDDSYTQIIKKTSLSEKINNILFVQESFGNASTQQNPNSSRFGNNIQIFYSNQQKLVSGRIQTNQFERARVVTFNELEKNFHVFYYLVAAYERRNQLTEYFQKLEQANQIDLDLLDQKDSVIKFLESLQLPTECILLGQQFIGDNDHFRFIDLLNHFYKLEFEDQEIFDIIRCVAGLIHLKQGNIDLASQILQIQNLLEILPIAQGRVTSLMSSTRNAESPVDGFIIDIYHNLFSWIELKINQNLQSENKIDTLRHKQLNIYDSFGFESISDPKTLEHQNSLQQLLLNYTNEKLQQFIYQEHEKRERELMKTEELQFEQGKFLNNSLIIEFFEKNFVPTIQDFIKLNRTDQHLEEKLIQFSQSQQFKSILINTDNLQKSTIGLLSEIKKIHRTSKRMFGINHTNGEIFYKIVGMIKNNLIAIDPRLRALQNESENSVIKQFKVVHSNKTLLELTIEQQQLLTSNLSQSETFFVKCVLNQNNNLQETLEKDILAYIEYFVRNYQYQVKVSHFLSFYPTICENIQTIQQLKEHQDINQIPQIKIGTNHIFLTVQAKSSLDFKENIAKQSKLNNIEQQMPEQCQQCITNLEIIQQQRQQIQELQQKVLQLEEQLHTSQSQQQTQINENDQQY